MVKLVLVVAFFAIGPSPLFAQGYCAQVKQGIDQYGYKAARQYPVEHYTRQEVRAADRCVAKLKLRRND